MKKVFNTTQSDLEQYNGVEVEIIRLLTKDEVDLEDVGNMYQVKLPNGIEIEVFEDELS